MELFYWLNSILDYLAIESVCVDFKGNIDLHQSGFYLKCEHLILSVLMLDASRLLARHFYNTCFEKPG